jgi:Chitobiase/beta-hexosaminidase C-terminal domain
MKAVFLALALACLSAYGQDDSGSMAVQQANQLAMQAGLQAAQQAQQDMQQAAQANLQAMQANQLAFEQCQWNSPSKNSFQIIGNERPNFSIKSGKVRPGTAVRIKWRCCNYSEIYYSTDGWTPTASSARYKGPIIIDSTTHFQAIAVGNSMRSPVVEADYIVDTPATAPAQSSALITDGLLRAGTALQLVTASVIDSKYAKVGDKIPLLLDQDVKVGDIVVIPKGTPVDAVLTNAIPAAGYSMPGDLVFVVHSMDAHGKPILLHGGETLEGVAGRGTNEAVIEPGMTVHVTVAADTTLKP